MLSYQHEYHAGNHADVLKHAVLALLIEALQRKPGALRVYDTHAGSGLYDLTAPEAARAREYQGGIARVIDAPLSSLAPYLAAVAAENPGGGLHRYPGSPAIARGLLRPDDHLELFELHPRAHAALKALFERDPQVHVHRRDGFEGLPAVSPPPEKRGLALIDPSYETHSDFANVLTLVPKVLRRWPHGVIAVWYPLLASREADRFADKLGKLALPKGYRLELRLQPPAERGLQGSGLVIANLPYGLEPALATLVDALHRQLGRTDVGGTRAEPLGAED